MTERDETAGRSVSAEITTPVRRFWRPYRRDRRLRLAMGILAPEPEARDNVREQVREEHRRDGDGQRED